MLLTLLQSQGEPPAPVILAGGGMSANAGPSEAHRWEIELLHAARMAAIAKTMAQSDRPQARRIAKKLEDYTGDIRQAESLRRAIAKLEAVQRERATRTALEIEKDEALRAAARELDNILLDEEEAMHAILAIEEFETRLMLSVLGIRLH